MVGIEEVTSDEMLIDRVTKGVASSASRRTMVRGLAAGLAMVAGGGIASDTLAGKRRKKKKGKKNRGDQPSPAPNPGPRSACAEVTSIGLISVPSDGSVVETPVLAKGQIYHLRAQGWWAQGGEYANDAYARYRFNAESEYNLSENGVRLGISVNGQSPDLWGHSANPADNYNRGHNYTMAMVGRDAPATLRVQDSNYNDNSRDLYVEVVCIPIA